ncbi:MAG: ECF transporter S component [Lachnospiraceae bacterium]|nr:ECF transporter S component [Lachnospiraceae bacterium]
MNTQSKTMRLTLMGLLTAVLLLMAYTPLGYLNIGPLAITFNVIPVALAAITLGPVGGAAMGAVFGLTSFLQCIGVGGTSAMGAILFDINPLLAFLQRFIPRVLDGFLLGYVFRFSSKFAGERIACMITGFCSAFFNTVFFMTSLVLLFGNTEYMQGLMGGKNIIVFICTFVGINAVFEMLASTLLTGAVGLALHKARVLPVYKQQKAAA